MGGAGATTHVPTAPFTWAWFGLVFLKKGHHPTGINSLFFVCFLRKMQKMPSLKCVSCDSEDELPAECSLKVNI